MDRNGPCKSLKLGNFVDREIGAIWWWRGWIPPLRRSRGRRWRERIGAEMMSLCSVRRMLPGPRDAVPETGTPSPIGNAFEFLGVQYTVGKVRTLPTRLYRSPLSYRNSLHLTPGGSGLKSPLSHATSHFRPRATNSHQAIGELCPHHARTQNRLTLHT